MGGSFGRRSSKTADYTVEAVEAAMGESVPVQIIWSREEDIRSGHYRPLFVHKLRGSVDDSGMPEAWHQVAVGQSLMQGTNTTPLIWCGVSISILWTVACRSLLACFPTARPTKSHIIGGEP